MNDHTPANEGSVPFGDRNVNRMEKRKLVREVFDGVAGRYDLMNDLMSVGLHRHWKRLMTGSVLARDARFSLDLAGGTGDIAFRLRRRFDEASVTVLDYSQEMLAKGRQRARCRRLDTGISWVRSDSAALPFPNGSFSLVTCAFGLRNLPEIGASLREVRRVLRPGGRFLSLEFFPPDGALKNIYERYLQEVIPRLGSAVAGKRDSYAYLSDSIRRFLPRQRLEEEFREAGLGAMQAIPRSFGIAVQHSVRRT